MKKAVIVLPTYNELEGIKSVIPEIFSITKNLKDWKVDVLVVDDNSPDGTADEVKRLQKRFPKKLHLLNGSKEGLGKAYIRGFAHAIEHFNPYVMFEMDADGQHPPSLIPSFLKKIDEGADFVIGSRYITGGSVPDAWTIDRKLFSSVGNLVAQLGFMNFKAKDWTSGYRCIKADFLASTLESMKGLNGYVFQIALLDKAFKKNQVVGEVPLNFVERIDGESKFSSLKYIYDSLRYILTESSFIRFSIVGLLGFLVDFGLAFILVEIAGIFTPTANALSAEVAIIFNFLINNFWSFNHKKIRGSYITKFLTFNLVSSGSILIQWSGLYIALHTLGDFTAQLPFGIPLPMWIVYKMAIIGLFVIPYSYFMYNRFIWKSPAKS